jgi:haloacetate dehalogenase
VVAPDLRGYGDSSKPLEGENHAGYSKRAMLEDQIAVMRVLGFDRFAVVGHDRGGRVAWRLAAARPGSVTQAVILDIVPRPYAQVTREFATAYFHWFFLIQPAPFPEQLIEAAPEAFLHRFLSRAGVTADASAEYLRALRVPGTAHAMCEDYRAGASIDEVHDAETRDQRVTCPLLVLWGERSLVGTSGAERPARTASAFGCS